MQIVYEELEFEFSQFKRDIENGVTFGKYFDEDDYEYEYSHNQIDEFKEKFVEKVEEYLRENVPGKYFMCNGYCVFVMTAEEAQKRRIYKYEEDIIK